MNNLSKTAKKIDIFFKIAFWVLSIIGGAILVIAILLLVFTDEYPEMIVETITLGSVNFDIASDYTQKTDISVSYSILEVVLGLVALGFVCYAIKIIRNILKPMREELPFSTSVSENLKKLAWVSFIGGGIFSIVNFVSDIAVYKIYDFEKLFLNGNVVGCSTTCIFDFSFLVIFAIFYLLSYVFRYGEVLQKQSDETL